MIVGFSTNKIKSKLKNVPPIIKGIEPTTAQNFFLTAKESTSLKNKYPILKKYIKCFIGGDEAISNLPKNLQNIVCGLKKAFHLNIIKFQSLLKDLKQLKSFESTADRIRKKLIILIYFVKLDNLNKIIL